MSFELQFLDSSASSYHTCTSAEISKISPPLEATAAGGAPANTKRRVEFLLDSITKDGSGSDSGRDRVNCQVSLEH